MLEKQYEKKVKQFLMDNHVYEAGTANHMLKKPMNGWFFKVWGGGLQRSGIPDIICNINGYFVAFELKATNGHPSPLQLKNIKMITDSNGVGLIPYPKDFDLVKSVVLELINK